MHVDDHMHVRMTRCMCDMSEYNVSVTCACDEDMCLDVTCVCDEDMCL